MRAFNAAVFDIETSALEAIGAGWLLLAVVKPLDGEPKVFRYDKLSCPLAHEKWLVKAVLKELSNFDLVIGHNLEKFDWPYLKSRAVVLDVPLPAMNPLYYDTMQRFKKLGYRTCDNGYGKPQAGLDKVADFFGFKPMKTRIDPREHWQTVWEKQDKRKESLDDLQEHCIGDVLDTERIFWKLWEADKTRVLKPLP